MKSFLYSTKSLAALLAGGLLLVPAVQAAPTLGAESPQALVERLRKAANTEDFGELAACLAPDARLEMAQGIWVGATMMIAMSSAMGDMAAGMGEAMDESEEGKANAAKAKAEAEAKFGVWKKRYDDTAKKHGLPTLESFEKLEGDPKSLLAKTDQVAVISDFGNLLTSFGEEQQGEKRPAKQIEGQLEGLKVDGDTAEGTLSGDPIKFVKIGDRWFIAELPQGGGGGEAPPEEEG
jgi:hypothetical protein